MNMGNFLQSHELLSLQFFQQSNRILANEQHQVHQSYPLSHQLHPQSNQLNYQFSEALAQPLQSISMPHQSHPQHCQLEPFDVVQDEKFDKDNIDEKIENIKEDKIMTVDETVQFVQNPITTIFNEFQSENKSNYELKEVEISSKNCWKIPMLNEIQNNFNQRNRARQELEKQNCHSNNCINRDIILKNSNCDGNLIKLKQRISECTPQPYTNTLNHYTENDLYSSKCDINKFRCKTAHQAKNSKKKSNMKLKSMKYESLSKEKEANKEIKKLHFIKNSKSKYIKITLNNFGGIMKSTARSKLNQSSKGIRVTSSDKNKNLSSKKKGISTLQFNRSKKKVETKRSSIECKQSKIKRKTSSVNPTIFYNRRRISTRC